MYIRQARVARARRGKVADKEKPEVKKPILHTHLCSTDQYPLNNWTKYVKAGYVKRLTDKEIEGKVLHIMGPSNGVWIATPKEMGQSITTLNWLYFIIKSVPDKQIVIDIQILDSCGVMRLFKFDSALTTTKLRHNIALLSLHLRAGYWTNLEIELPFLVSRNYDTNFAELMRIQIHGSCLVRRVFSTSEQIHHDDLPMEYRLNALQSAPPPSAALYPPRTFMK